MNARLRCWVEEWDWRPLARTIIWLGVAAVVLKRSGYRPPSLDAIVRELVLGFLLTAGLLTRLQVWLLMAALRLFMAVDDWTYALAERLVRPVAGRASFAVNFMAALGGQLILVLALLVTLHSIRR